MLRSLLFVPGDADVRFPKALDCGADAVIVDLEDAVDSTRKADARDNVGKFLAVETSVRRYVRINGLETDEVWADVEAIVKPGLDGIMLPKFHCGEDVQRLDWLISRFERSQGLQSGAIEIMPLVESASGVASLIRLTEPLPRVRHLTFGAVDLRQDLGLRVDRDETQLSHLQWTMVVASRAANLGAPIDTVYVNIKDGEGYAKSLRRASDFGFGGKLCIHPSQVAPANAAFLPSAEEMARAKAVIAAYAAKGNAGAVQVEGMMVDKPVLDWARTVVSRGSK
jgi:citrate lyase subunit beta / citryl-CoA lyase